MSELLRIENLHVSVGEKELLHGINLTVNSGESSCHHGGERFPESRRCYTPLWEIQPIRLLRGIFFQREDITDLTTDKRARKGIFLSFQSPCQWQGLLQRILYARLNPSSAEKQQRLFPFKRLMKLVRMTELAMDESYAGRYLNDGFSGGERKKNEILQMRILDPALAMLDETDSGLDVDAVRIVADNIRKYHNENNALIMITHLNQLLKFVPPDKVHVLIGGRIVKEGGAELVDEIEDHGFDAFKSEV